MRMRKWVPVRMRRWLPPVMLEEMGWPFPWRPLHAFGSQRVGDGFAWVPAAELRETADAFIIRVDLPGMRREDINISLLGITLTVQGERRPPLDTNVKEEERQTSELCYGRFSRSIVLPENIQSDRIEATYDSGILEVRIAKVPGARPTRIEVKSKQD